MGARLRAPAGGQLGRSDAEEAQIDLADTKFFSVDNRRRSLNFPRDGDGLARLFRQRLAADGRARHAVRSRGLLRQRRCRYKGNKQTNRKSFNHWNFPISPTIPATPKKHLLISRYDRRRRFSVKDAFDDGLAD